jgi:hypothetical protein
VVRGLEQFWVGCENQRQFSALELGGRSGGQGGGRALADRPTVLFVRIKQFQLAVTIDIPLYSQQKASTLPRLQIEFQNKVLLFIYPMGGS